YLDWSTAATNIQDAIDSSALADLILVTNGNYKTGGRPAPGTVLTNRVLIDKAITVQSVNGPTFTILSGVDTIQTATNVRCAFVASGAVPSGFTPSGGGSSSTSTY